MYEPKDVAGRYEIYILINYLIEICIRLYSRNFVKAVLFFWGDAGVRLPLYNL
jgi:hypothetical protein